MIAALIGMAVALVVVLASTVWLVRSARTETRAERQRAEVARRDLQVATEKHEKALTQRGKAAARSSRSTFDGHLAETAFPYAAAHGYHPKDIVHVGGVIDFLVFDGLFDIRQGLREAGELTVVLADVKFNSSALTPEQRAVIAAMNEGRTRGECWKAREEEGSLLYRRHGDAPAQKGKKPLTTVPVQEGSPDAIEAGA